MWYKLSSLLPVLNCFQNNEQRKAGQIADKLGKSNVIIHKYLKELIKQGKLEKHGAGPHATYSLIWKQIMSEIGETVPSITTLSYKDTELLENEFYKFTPDGQILTGKQWFIQRCQMRNLDPQQKVHDFVSIYTHIQSSQNQCGVLDAITAFSQTMPDSAMSHIFYADQYKRMDFGRGKLAEMTFYAKQSQQKQLINQCIDLIINKLECLIHTYKINAIAITPHSIDRKNQLLEILHKRLQWYWLPFIKLIKYYPHNIAIPQKSLKTRAQRIDNAKNTIFVDSSRSTISLWDYQHVLLIDDFVWSGATLNETAKKIRNEWVHNIIWFAFVGNTNLSYDVINEV